MVIIPKILRIAGNIFIFTGKSVKFITERKNCSANNKSGCLVLANCTKSKNAHNKNIKKTKRKFFFEKELFIVFAMISKK